MRNPFVVLDTTLIEKLERLCQKIQRQIGWTNFTLAKFASSGIGVMSLMYLWDHLGKATSIWEYGCVASAFNALLFSYFTLETIDDMARKRTESLKNRTANDIKCNWVDRCFRIITLVTLTSLILRIASKPDLLLVVFGGCMAAFVYLIACDPLPPSRSRLRQWIETFGLTPVRIKSK